MRALLVEDDAELAKAVAAGRRHQALAADPARDAADALDQAAVTTPGRWCRTATTPRDPQGQPSAQQAAQGHRGLAPPQPNQANAPAAQPGRVGQAWWLLSFTELRDWLLEAGFAAVDGYGQDGAPLSPGSRRLLVVATADGHQHGCSVVRCQSTGHQMEHLAEG